MKPAVIAWYLPPQRLVPLCASLLMLLACSAPADQPASVQATPPCGSPVNHMDVSPRQGAILRGTQVFRVAVPSLPLDSYQVTWQVDGRPSAPMPDSEIGAPCKETSADLAIWDKRTADRHQLTFRATTKSGTTIAVADITIYVPDIKVISPADGTTVSNRQSFQVQLGTVPLDLYKMDWRVDGGKQNLMFSSPQNKPYKQSDLDLSGWNWRASHHYVVTFTAFDRDGRELATKNITLVVP
jgi:hypothetical protein